ncbi:hypothetical protein N9934_05420, partial [Desulfosarcina sp.]|nr:hypothetical protein [Desulfosarcina sp.]
ALDMVDLGLTVSKEPGFALFLEFPPTIIPIGYSNVDGKLLGIGSGKFGSHDFSQHATGYLVGGTFQRNIANFDPEDPEALPTYETGLMGHIHDETFLHKAPEQNEERPKVRAVCPKTLHLGYIGIDLTCHPVDMLDFILGFATIDIGNDDAPGFWSSKKDTEEVIEE